MSRQHDASLQFGAEASIHLSVFKMLLILRLINIFVTITFEIYALNIQNLCTSIQIVLATLLKGICSGIHASNKVRRRCAPNLA